MNKILGFSSFLIAAILIGAATILLLPFFGVRESENFDLSPSERAINRKLKIESRGEQALNFNLVDPQQAPPQIHEAVRLGYHLILNTPKYASQYVGDRLSCTNCHFAGGNTTGGKGGSVSLAGIAAVYPTYNSRKGIVEDLPMRINSCFERSMNGKPLPPDSPEMVAIVTYLHWISKDMPIYQKISWRGLPDLKTTHKPDPEQGKHVYEVYCAMCHGTDGLGEIDNHIPPLWGPHSFNDGAGMNIESVLAAFIYNNMPYPDAGLSAEQAQDVAAFISHQPRPHFSSQK